MVRKGKSEVLWALSEVWHCDENISLKIFCTTLELFIQWLCNHISCGIHWVQRGYKNAEITMVDIACAMIVLEICLMLSVELRIFYN